VRVPLIARSQPTLVAAGVLRLATILPGVRATCGITLAGGAYRWGENDYGQLGRGTASAGPDAIPTRVVP